VRKLAKLLVVDMIPAVWVPPRDVRELRALVAHRRQLIKNRTMLQNHLESILHRHQLVPPAGKRFSAEGLAWWKNLKVSPTEQLHIQHDLATLATLEPQIAEVDAELQRLSVTEPWAAQTTYLMQLPGFGVLVTLTLLAAIGQIPRFETAKKLVGYAGLGASVHSSGETHRTGHITKSGRRDLRWALVQAAWVAVDTHPYWQAEFAQLTRRMDKNTAIVAIARKLLVAVWHVLSERAADTHAETELVAAKLMRWSWDLTPEQRGGLTTRQFIRYHLMRLHLGADLTHFSYNKKPRRIAAVEDMPAGPAELQPSG
jgi:transposase